MCSWCKKWFDNQLLAGRAVAKCLKTSKDLIENQTPNLSLKDIEAECEKIISDADCTPTFKGYRGFPGAICASVNRAMVHGIPSDYVLQEGDVVKIDLGATYEGAIGDAAISAIYGEPKDKKHVEMMAVCKESLKRGIEAMEIGKQIGCIGNAIYKYVKNYNFKLITQYGGHGISYNKPHSNPFIFNKSRPNEGVRIQPGLTIAIEPMLAIGSSKTKILKDGWTVVTQDISCHWEHTVFVGEDKVHIMTDWENLDE